MTKKLIKLKNNTDNEVNKDLSKLFGKYMKQLLKAAELKLKILWATKNSQISFTEECNRNTLVK